MKQLVITADDFGAAREVNDAVEAAHVNGALSAASLMVGAPACADAVRLAKRLPSLRVGLHLVLVEGRPVLPARDVPDLVDKDGCFRNDMAASGARMFFSPAARAQLAAEIAAQFEAFAATGLTLDHCNAHKHFHLHPTILGLMVAIGKRFGLRAMRVPSEPRNVLAKIERVPASVTGWVMAPWLRLMRRQLRAAGILAPDNVFGLAWSGHMTKDRLLGLVHHLPEGLSEIYLHPATGGDFPGAAPTYRYRDELAALLSPELTQALRDAGVRRGGFADFHQGEQGGTVVHASRNGARSSTP